MGKVVHSFVFSVIEEQECQVREQFSATSNERRSLSAELLQGSIEWRRTEAIDIGSVHLRFIIEHEAGKRTPFQHLRVRQDMEVKNAALIDIYRVRHVCFNC